MATTIIVAGFLRQHKVAVYSNFFRTSQSINNGVSRSIYRSFSNSQPVSSDQKVYDVFIVGGGAAGSAIATLLSKTTNDIPLTIGVLDSRRPAPLSSYKHASSDQEVGPVARSYALSPASLATLGIEENGTIDRIRKLGRVSDYDKMQVCRSVFLRCTRT